MSRAALGHTGRALRVHPAIVASYVLVSAAALLRITATVLSEIFAGLLVASGIAWTAAFLLLLWIYAPILIAPRPDGRPG
jgi:uncharacterized protein involved in response to NO